jgi:signal transduction histidine kinase/ActR/RegA family two-component response regulator
MSYPKLFKEKITKKNKSKENIRWNFTITNQLRYGLISLVLFASLITSGLVANFSFRTQLNQSIYFQQIQSELAAQKIDSYLDDLQQKLKYLARIKGLTNLDNEIQENLLIALTRNNRAYEFVAIFDKNGEQIAGFSSYEKINLTNQKQEDFFQKSFRDQRDYIGEVTLDKKLNIPVVTFAFPIRNNQDEVAGVLLAKINLKFLWVIVSQTPVGKTGYIYIIDNRLFLIASNESSEKKPEIKDISQLDYIQKLTPQLLSPESQFLHQYQGLNNQSVLGAIANIPTVNWKVIVEMPTAEIYQPLNTMLISIFLTLIVAGLITIVISYLLTKQIIDPLQKLTATATEIQRGNFDIKLTLKSHNEFRILAQAFNQMAKELKQSFANLEKNNQELEERVKKRTQQLEEALNKADEANKAKSQFLTNVSHELRTPLNGILGIAQILQDAPHLSPYEKEEINIIYQSGSHLLTLINDILDLSKIEAGKIELNYQLFSFPKLLQGIISIFQIQARNKNIEFQWNFNGQIPLMIECDETRIRQVLINLLSNAIKFTKMGLVIFNIDILNMENNFDNNQGNKNKQLTNFNFKIEDTGIGIPPQKINLIFLPFEQVYSQNFKAEGTGLGLAISQKLVQMMGGEIKVESNLGKGSIFSFEIKCFTIPFDDFTFSKNNSNQNSLNPIFNQIDNQSSDKINNINIPVETKINPLDKNYKNLLSFNIPLKILLAEDNKVNQKVAQKIFKSLGYTIDIVSNGQEAISAIQSLEKEKYDVIFMDILMPEMDGLEATQKICTMLTKENRPVIIAMTANAMEGDRETCLNVGMDDYISKPVKIDQLTTIIIRHFSNQ